MEKKKVYILEDTFYYKKGQLVEGKKEKDGIIVDNNFISEDNYITEALDAQDIKKIQQIFRKQLETLFWRLYTRSSFLTK